MQQEIHWYLPQNTQQLTHFYFYLCAGYFVVHVLWDAFSKKTPAFSLENLQYKMNELFSSATFATSAFFVVILFDLTNPLRNSDAFIFPLIYSAFSGAMISLSAMVPKARS
ncbi:hypothetical protein [Serratia marcescens]|uniref:hypothetical protein n=1 Tax=Serratia marcescens TaxID=615 RepID=UPI001EF460B0|nr:hypothetical protein [Serratia marcescens]